MKIKSIFLLSFVLLFLIQAYPEGQNPDVKTFEEKILQARPLPLNKVRLTGGPLKQAQDVTVKYLPVEPDRPLVLVVTYYSDEGRRGKASFDILIEGKKISHQEVIRSTPPRFFDVKYAIDPNNVKGKEKVTVRFETTEGNSIASVFGIRMIRRDKDD